MKHKQADQLHRELVTALAMPVFPSVFKRRCSGSPCDCITQQAATHNDEGKPVWRCLNCRKERLRKVAS